LPVALFVLLFSGVSLLLATVSASAQNFQGLGFLPGFDYSEASGVSADGKTVAGNIRPIGHESDGSSQAISWTTSSGIVALGFPAGTNMSRALGLSADGRTLVGYGQLLNGGGPNGPAAAFSWTSTAGFGDLGTLPGSSDRGFATATNADGSVVVGAATGTACCGAQAIRWTASTGMVSLGVLPGATGAVANGVSGDGTVVVGYSSTNEAFRWTAPTGMVGLGFLPGGGNNSKANAVSADGAVVVGNSQNGLGFERAFRWTSATGMVAIGGLPGALFSQANAVNADGSVIVGTSGSGGASDGAYRWTQATGIQSIPAILSAGGFGPANWSLQTAQGVSADGTVIVGNGVDPAGKNEAWIAQIPVNAFALLDLNGADHTLGSLVWGGVVTNSGPGKATLTVGSDNANSTFSGSIQDGAASTAFVKQGGGTQVLTGASTYTGGTTINAGTLQLGSGGTSGSILGNVLNNGALAFNRSDTYRFDGVITGSGIVQQNGTGTVILTGINTYTGATFVNAGTLEVDGAITSSSAVTVNAGGRLTGTGLVDPPNVITIASGATFAPGNGTAGSSMTVAGNLAFQSGAIYLVQISPAAASFANVTGTAALGGTVNAVFAPGAYLGRSYTILHSAGLGGTTFAGLTATNVPIGIAASLSYSGTDVLLNLVGSLGIGSSLNGNQQNVATGINNFFNNGGMLPPNFASLFALSGAPLGNALSRLSGEVAADAPNGAFKLNNQFLNLMLDPFVDGRSGGGWPNGANSANGGAMGFAPERANVTPPDVALAYAKALKAPAPRVFEQRWGVWGSSYGGSSITAGDPVAGSNDARAADYGFAGGFDYHVSPDTTAGFALAGGGTNWSVAQGLGSGRSDAFQTGFYGVSRLSAAYVAAALAFANHWMTTDRTSFAFDQLHASFQGQSYSGRLEAGYRFAALPAIGITPYAAVQAQNFHTPVYSETDVTAGGFGLTYAARNVTDTRSELGARFDGTTMIKTMPLALRARLAWAHDWVSGTGLSAAFQALPGAAFIVSGAVLPKDSALASAGVDLHVTPNWVLAAKFDGEFASRSQTYAGTGTVRYTW